MAHVTDHAPILQPPQRIHADLGSYARWHVPVLDPLDLQIRDLVVYAVRGQVLLINPPGVAWILPPNTDGKLAGAFHEARLVTAQYVPQYIAPDDDLPVGALLDAIGR